IVPTPMNPTVTVSSAGAAHAREKTSGAAAVAARNLRRESVIADSGEPRPAGSGCGGGGAAPCRSRLARGLLLVGPVRIEPLPQEREVEDHCRVAVVHALADFELALDAALVQFADQALGLLERHEAVLVAVDDERRRGLLGGAEEG